MFGKSKEKDDAEDDEFEYEPADDDRDRRYEYKSVDIDMDGQNLGEFLNHHTQDGWRYVRDIDGGDIGNLGATKRGVAHLFIFERPVEPPAEDREDAPR